MGKIIASQLDLNTEQAFSGALFYAPFHYLQHGQRIRSLKLDSKKVFTKTT